MNTLFTDYAILAVGILVFGIGGAVKGIFGIGLPIVVVTLLGLVMEPIEVIALLPIAIMATNIRQFFFWQCRPFYGIAAVCHLCAGTDCSDGSLSILDFARTYPSDPVADGCVGVFVRDNLPLWVSPQGRRWLVLANGDGPDLGCNRRADFDLGSNNDHVPYGQKHRQGRIHRCNRILVSSG